MSKIDRRNRNSTNNRHPQSRYSGGSSSRSAYSSPDDSGVWVIETTTADYGCNDGGSSASADNSASFDC